MVKAITSPTIQQFTSVDGTINNHNAFTVPVKPQEDVFEGGKAKTPAVKRPQNNLVDEAFWQAHFLLDQQKRANLHIAQARNEIDHVINGDIAKALQTGDDLRQDLQKFERLKAWKTKAESPDLGNNEQFLMSLLRLFSDRENVRLVDWLNIGPDNYEEYRAKMQLAAFEHEDASKKFKEAQGKVTTLGSTSKKIELEQAKLDARKCERMSELTALKLGIMGKKAKIFEAFMRAGRSGKTPIEVIQHAIRLHVAPASNAIKEWTFFGRKCVELATELTLTVNKFNSSLPKSAQTQLLHTIKDMVAQVDGEFAKERALLTTPSPNIDEVIPTKHATT